MPPRLEHRVGDLAVNVELELRRRRVADANRTSALEAGEPRYLPLRETPLAAGAVHDLQLVRASGDGPEQPVAPVARLVLIPGRAERHQREGRVAQPAIA